MWLGTDQARQAAERGQLCNAHWAARHARLYHQALQLCQLLVNGTRQDAWRQLPCPQPQPRQLRQPAKHVGGAVRQLPAVELQRTQRAQAANLAHGSRRQWLASPAASKTHTVSRGIQRFRSTAAAPAAAAAASQGGSQAAWAAAIAQRPAVPPSAAPRRCPGPPMSQAVEPHAAQLPAAPLYRAAGRGASAATVLAR